MMTISTWILNNANPLLYKELGEQGLRPYIANALDNASDRKILCWGRRTGKTSELALEAVLAMTGVCPEVEKASKVLFFSPSNHMSENFLNKVVQVAKGFDIFPTVLKKKMVSFGSSTLYSLSLSPWGHPPCGESADLVLAEEIPCISRGLFHEAVFPLLCTNSRARIVVASTPSSVKENNLEFEELCNSYDSTCIHISGYDIPGMTDDVAIGYKRICGEKNFNAEFLAEFPKE